MATPTFLTVEEAAAVLRIGRTAAYEAARRYRATGGAEGIPVYKVGGTLRVPRHKLEEIAGGTIDLPVGRIDTRPTELPRRPSSSLPPPPSLAAAITKGRPNRACPSPLEAGGRDGPVAPRHKEGQTSARTAGRGGRVLRVRTLYARSSGASARYYTQYLQADDGERPGTWAGDQASGLGLSGPVDAAALEAVLSGYDPVTGERLGSKLVDRFRSNGTVIRSVAGFDATFSAPKSVSAWWGLTQDEGLRAAHDLAVSVVLDHIEAHATTRVRVNGPRIYPDVANGLTMAVFPQSTSREDDPQLHTHAVISTKVLAPNGRWYALDGHYVKNNQRALGGLYQSVLRAELTHRFGVTWGPVEDGQAELAAMPHEILEVFSKRTPQVEHRRLILVDSFRERNGRDPTRWEHAAIKREAAADSRQPKTHLSVEHLSIRWRAEADEVGWTPERLTRTLTERRPVVDPPRPPTVGQVLDLLSAKQSTWTRADVLSAICDLAPTPPGTGGRDWARVLERVADEVVASQRNLDPAGVGEVRGSDGRSIWMDPSLSHLSDDTVIAQEDRIIGFAMEAQSDEPAPSRTVDTNDLDLLQAVAAEAVAGHDRLVLVVGPAGTGKTNDLARATADLSAHGRPVFGLAPTAKAARVLSTETATAPRPWPSSCTNGTDRRGHRRPIASGRGRRCWWMRPACSGPTASPSSCVWLRLSGDGWFSLVTLANSTPSAGAACSTNCAEPDEPTTWPPSIAS